MVKVQYVSTIGYEADDIRQNFTGYQNDDETNLDYAQARMYSSVLGRFSSSDPVIMFKLSLSPQLWNKYAYAQNNPIVMVDVTGEFPYTVYVRSFAPPGSFRGRGFNDDKRGFSTDTSSSTSSKVQQEITIDPTAQTWGNHRVSSSPSNWNGIVEATENPSSTVTQFETQVSNGISVAGVSTEYSGLNPLTKKISEALTPAINVQANITIGENLKTGQIAVGVSITGDGFPATEAIVADKSGNKVFIVGANAFGTPETGLPGNPKHNLASATLLINTDKKGNFTGVVYGGKTYSVKDWNAKATESPAQILPRKDLKCNCL